MKYTRNYNPDFYTIYSDETNCGSFALNIEEWYSPDDIFMGRDAIESWIMDRCNEGLSEEESSDLYAQIVLKQIFEDFPDVRSVYPWEVEDDEELIAFRAFVDYTCDWDFHFKVLRDGRWQEKCGDSEVRDCKEYDWDYNYFSYTSETYYLAKKII